MNHGESLKANILCRLSRRILKVPPAVTINLKICFRHETLNFHFVYTTGAHPLYSILLILLKMIVKEETRICTVVRFVSAYVEHRILQSVK
jgi:hypothetical protein